MVILSSSFLSTLVIGIAYKRNNSKHLLAYTGIFSLFTLTILLSLNIFHDLIFYCIVTAMMAVLFVVQAKELVAEKMARKEDEALVAKLQFALEKQQNQSKARIKISSAGKTQLLQTDSIAYLKAAGDYVEIFLTDQQLSLYSGSLKSLEEQLPSSFLKVHRSYIVNLDHMTSISTVNTSTSELKAGQGVLTLLGGEQVPISRRIYPMVRGIIQQI